MSSTDTAPELLSPERENMMAFQLAQKALRYMAMWLSPFIIIAAWLGYDNYARLDRRYEEKLATLEAATRESKEKADLLSKLADSLEHVLDGQRWQLAFNGQEAAASRSRLQADYDQLAEQTSSDRHQLLHDVRTELGRVNDRAGELQQSFTFLDSTARSDFERMLTQANEANAMAQRAVQIAEESGVQTVGAGHRQQLYGTPYEVYFEGVSRDALRDLVIYRVGGGAVERRVRVPSHESIEIPSGNPEFVVRVVNVLDIPGGLLRLTGSSRADAATFRVERVARPSAGLNASTSRPPQRD
jgi:signal transduction histidine kinase